MMKKPGRVKLVCKCGKAFSTHSSNRDLCHTCKPKAPKHPVYVPPTDEPQV